MSGSYTLTKSIDHETFLADLAKAGVVAAVAIGGNKVFLSGKLWDNMDDRARAAEIDKVAAAEVAHSPNNITEVLVAKPPHLRKLQEELASLDCVTSAAVLCPQSAPWNLVIRHNPLTESERDSLRNAVLAHDASVVGQLLVDTPSQVIAADGVTSGTVKVRDSRGASAAGKEVRLRIPPGGPAGADADRVVLDSNGEATITFQPTSVYTGELMFELFYDNAESDPVIFTVRRGS